MPTTIASMWSDVLAQIRLNHPELVRGWFCDLSMGKLDGGVVPIQAMNHAQCQYLERYCRPAFSEAAQAATGRLVSVLFEVRPGEELNRPLDDALPLDRKTAGLNPDYTFENFVAGPCNRLAHAAGTAIAEEPGETYNPFFLHGSAGLGKTHLLQAVCHAVQQRNPDGRCVYLTCEAFINQFIEAVERGLISQFQNRYRQADVLAIDDIQFLSERERSQEEFFHTFNALHQGRRQVLLSADCPPAEIPSLQERLVSRFNSGLVAAMDRPCLETRMAILRKKAKARCVEVPDEVIRFASARITCNVRELEGALNKLDALSLAKSSAINLELAREALGDGPGRPVKVSTVLEVVAERFGINVSDLQGKRRSKAVTHPRHVCMYLARLLTNHSLDEIGAYLGGRDHSTVVHAHRTITDMANRDAEFRGLLDEIAAGVKNVAV